MNSWLGVRRMLHNHYVAHCLQNCRPKPWKEDAKCCWRHTVFDGVEWFR